MNLVDLEKSCKINLNEYLVVKIGFDTAENEPSKVSRKWGVQTGSARGHVFRSHSELQVRLRLKKQTHCKDSIKFLWADCPRMRDWENRLLIASNLLYYFK